MTTRMLVSCPKSIWFYKCCEKKLSFWKGLRVKFKYLILIRYVTLICTQIIKKKKKKYSFQPSSSLISHADWRWNFIGFIFAKMRGSVWEPFLSCFWSLCFEEGKPSAQEETVLSILSAPVFPALNEQRNCGP